MSQGDSKHQKSSISQLFPLLFYSKSLLYLPLFLLISHFPSHCSGDSNPKTKCSLECYALCMQSGTATASICNCVLPKDSKNCTIFDEQVRSAIISPTLPKMRSEYVDAHMIKVSIDPHPRAFAFIFEYSAISTEPHEWIFAGASEKPETTFTILDPCRDYQFRVLIVLRSTNPLNIIEIIRPQPIPVKLPPFVLLQPQINIELPPSFPSNSSTDLKMYIKWSLPNGYTDGDIYGYESPALYPIQCSTPEAELPQPRIEILKGGGRLAVSLPSSVLEARCRMWVEVRMLPRCVRLEPFNIQKNIEIDCSKNPDMDVCSKDSNPVCFENVEISGEKGKARISWEKPSKSPPPIYYHVRYGPAHTKGVAPFISWQLAAKREVRVDGSLTTFTLDVPEDEDFGVQVCAILSKKRKRPKFGVVHVIPFQCSSCKPTQSSSPDRCDDCAAIVGSTVLERDWLTSKKPLDPSSIPTKATIYRMETDLKVDGSRSEKHSVLNSGTRHATDSPIELEKAEEILEPSTTILTTKSTTVAKKKTTIAPTTTTTTPITTTVIPTTTVEESTTTEMVSKNRKLLSAEVDKSIENLEKVILDTVNGNLEKSDVNTTMEIDEQMERRLEEAAKQLQDTLTNLVANSSSDIRHHEKAKKCLTSDGVVCEFGCEDRKTCICPSETHARLISGVCASRDTMLHTICFPRKEINATWDAETGNILVRRSDALYHIENAEYVDKLFVEFGKVDISETPSNETKIEFIDSKSRSKIVVQIQTVLKSSVFSTEPFIFHVNQSIDINNFYGMRFCVFNSSQIRHPHTYNWDDVSRFEKNQQIAEVIQLSPVRFTNKLQSFVIIGNGAGGQSYWNTVVTVAKIAILVALGIAMFVLVYLNCTKIKTLYDRKRTHYFRPFYIDPSIHLANPANRTSGLKREPSRGYYDVRNSHLIM